MYNGAGERAAYPPPFYNGDDIADLDAEFVRLIKVLQSTHVCGHGLEKTQKNQIKVVCKPTKWRNMPSYETQHLHLYGA